MKHKEIIAVFDNDEDLVNAIRKLQEKKIPIRDAYTPFPVHDVLHLLGRETRLPYVAVIAGAINIVAALGFLYWVAVIDYPLNFGGKPAFTLPTFVVITYLLTILLTFIVTAIVFQIRTGLFPGNEPVEIMKGSTDDKFILAIGAPDGFNDGEQSMADSILWESGATEVYERDREIKKK
jgi:hypothetical protein